MARELAALHAARQLRELTIPRGIQLGSNDYLGLSTHPRLKETIARAVHDDARVASTGSRLLSGNHERWEELEAEFAAFVGAEAALYFPSGYAANIGLLSSVLKREDTVYSDAANHASLIDGIRLSRARKIVWPHLDLDFLEDSMRRDATASRKVVVVESIFSMEGDHAPLAELASLCDRFGASLIVDDAHGTGVEDAPFGDGGNSCTSGFPPPPKGASPFSTVHTCGKALASLGAFVAGSRLLRDYLINHARTFIFSTALPPYCAAHVREAIALVSKADAERTHLRHLSNYLRNKLRAAGFDIGRSDSQIIPVLLGSNKTALRFAASLTAAGFAIRAIRPPTVPAGAARLRLSVNATLSLADIDALVNTLSATREIEVVLE